MKAIWLGHGAVDIKWVNRHLSPFPGYLALKLDFHTSHKYPFSTLFTPLLALLYCLAAHQLIWTKAKNGLEKNSTDLLIRKFNFRLISVFTQMWLCVCGQVWTLMSLKWSGKFGGPVFSKEIEIHLWKMRLCECVEMFEVIDKARDSPLK